MSVTKKKLIVGVELRGKLNPSVRTLRATVIPEMANNNPMCQTDKIYVGFTVGRNKPTVRWDKAKVGMGLELVIDDAELMSAAEDACMEYLMINDRPFVERYFESK